jgi:hypothetical protein
VKEVVGIISERMSSENDCHAPKPAMHIFGTKENLSRSIIIKPNWNVVQYKEISQIEMKITLK